MAAAQTFDFTSKLKISFYVIIIKHAKAVYDRHGTAHCFKQLIRVEIPETFMRNRQYDYIRALERRSKILLNSKFV
jgi:hypothetical protein